MWGLSRRGQQDVVRRREQGICKNDQADPMGPAIGLNILILFLWDLHTARLMPSEIGIVRPARVCDRFEYTINGAVARSLQLE